MSVLLWPSLAWPLADDLAQLQEQVYRHPVSSMADARQARDAAHGRGDASAELQALRQLALAAWVGDSLAQEQAAVKQAQALAERLGSAAGKAEMLVHQALLNVEGGQGAEAARQLDAAEAIARGAALPRHLATVLLARTALAYAEGRDADAAAQFHLAHATALACGDRFSQAWALIGLGNLDTDTRSGAEAFERGIHQFEAAVETLDSQTYPGMALSALNRIGYALASRDRHAEARPYLVRAVEAATQLGSPAELAYANLALAQVEMHDGHYAAATQRLDAAAVRSGPEFFSLRLWLARARLLSLQGAGGASLQALRRAEEELKSQDAPPRCVQYLETAAAVHARLGDLGHAYRLMEQLRKAEREASIAANDRLLARSQAAFELRRKEQENQLLKARQREAEARRLALWLALGCSVLLAIVLVLVLRWESLKKRRMTQLAWQDELTSLPNRRRMLQILQGHLDDRRADGTTAYVALLDVDHFKQVNDRHGHDVGDAVLKAFGAACRGTLRDSDTFGRFGGEEFLAILRPVEGAMVQSVFFRMREAVHGIRLPDHPELKISFSMGVATASCSTLEQVLKRADTALYEAKHGGRDRCVVAPAAQDAPAAPAAIPATTGQ